MTENIKVLTLNCWGVFFPYVTDRKIQRIKAIRDRLALGEFDIIFLQEIWLPDDFRIINEILNKQYCSTYFHGKFIGSGMCIFSKWPIESVLFHAFAANGYPHLILNGDWFCGKGVGLARITTTIGVKINLYITHLIARYSLDHNKDKYSGHRAAQIIEIMEFVRLTSPGSDVTIIAGDFNCEADTTSIELFRTSLDLSDAWLHNLKVESSTNTKELEIQGCTCDRADNPYSNQLWTQAYGNGERLDYIFYRIGPRDASSSCTINCNTCYLDMRQIPDIENNLHYSDHEGVVAEFTITTQHTSNQVTIIDSMSKIERLKELCIDLNEKLTIGLQKCQSGRQKNFISLVTVYLLLFCIILTCPTNQHWLEAMVRAKLVAVLGAVLFALFWGTVVGRNAEQGALKNALQSTQFLLNGYRSFGTKIRKISFA